MTFLDAIERFAPILLIAFPLLFSTSADLDGESKTEESSVDRSETTTHSFEIRTDQFRIKEGTIPRAETFSALLSQYGVDYQTILDLVEAARPSFDVQDLRAGRPYRVFVNPWLQEVSYFVYEMSPARSVVFDIRQPERTHIEARSIQKQWTNVQGTIEGSLYETLVEKGGHPLLALRLSEVFAWQIDFFRLRAGDRFRLIYEKRTVGGESLQPGDIVAAHVEHLGQEYYAFRFDVGDGAEYFNRQGQSLRRQLLKAPLQYSRISSRFTNRRFHPILKEYRPHHGTDYAAPTGTPVRSVGEGEVQQAGYRGANGNYVKIRHNGTYTSGYLHLSQLAVEPGQEVEQGETIGYVGSTGRSTGPHLDYRLWKHGTAVDPYSLDLPPSQPVPIQYREEFERMVDALLPRLQRRSVFALRQGRSPGGEGLS